MCCVMHNFLHVQLCLPSWSTHVKRKRQSFCPHFITIHFSIYQSIAENVKAHNSYLRNQRICRWICGDVKGYQILVQPQIQAREYKKKVPPIITSPTSETDFPSPPPPPPPPPPPFSSQCKESSFGMETKVTATCYVLFFK